MTKEEFYNEFKDWTKEEMLSRAYDICLKNIELQQRTEKAVEYIKDNYLYYEDRLEDSIIKERYKKDIQVLLDILNGRSDE